MRYLILLLALLCAPTFAQAWPGRVVSVHDGDSIRVQRADDGRVIPIRVYGIDCPELGQPYGEAALQLTHDTLRGQEVDVLPVGQHHSYGREVASIILAQDKRAIQDVLVGAGLAWVDGRYCKTAVCDLWRQYQADAKAARRGLWADDSPIPPWTWRRMR